MTRHPKGSSDPRLSALKSGVLAAGWLEHSNG